VLCIGRTTAYDLVKQRLGVGSDRDWVGTVAEVDGHADLTERWEACWPDCRPIGHELRYGAPDRWVRFHSLPGSKRYAETPDETAEVIARHNTVLGELVGGPSEPGESPTVLVITCAWGSSLDREREPELLAADPSASYWRSELKDVEPGYDDVWTHLWVSRRAWSPGDLDQLLLLAADWVTADLIIAAQTLSWLYHPYDGGADVIAPSTAIRDLLARDHKAWLSDRPDGL
jgi:hypothetical protein